MQEKTEASTVETVTVSREEFDGLVKQLNELRTELDAKVNTLNDSINLTRSDLTAKLTQATPPVVPSQPTKTIDEMTDDELPTW